MIFGQERMELHWIETIYQFQNPEVFPSHKIMFTLCAYDLENFFYLIIQAGSSSSSSGSSI